MGIVFGEQISDLFARVQLPDGWRKERTRNVLWSSLLDDEGRTRASIFYKAAFYNNQAFIRLCHRYNISSRPIVNGSEDCQEIGWESVAIDWDGSVLWQSEPMRAEPERCNMAAWSDWYQDQKKLLWQAEAWLDEHKSDWRNPMAYWDEPCIPGAHE